MSSRFRGWVAVGLSTRLGIHLFVACTHWLVEAGLLTHIHTCRAVYVVTASKRGFKVGLSPHGELSVAVGIRHAGSSRLGLRQLYKRFPPQASHHRKPVENRFTTAGCLLRSPQASTQNYGTLADRGLHTRRHRYYIPARMLQKFFAAQV